MRMKIDTSTQPILPLPVSWEECRQRGWEYLDILLVCGDAYIDHPSFGVALIGRYLQAKGYRVAILAQPRYHSAEDFQKFPEPKLFCGITAGNLDSIVANYTSNAKVRDNDAYSPNGNPWRTATPDRNSRYRPDRATLIYSNLARATFPETLLVLGGIEASLRRFVHYDYQQQKLRASVLTDAKADLLVFGMGEKAVAEIAERRMNNQPTTGIAGTCERLTDQNLNIRYPNILEKSGQALILPSYTEIIADHDLFLSAETAIDAHCRAAANTLILQKQQTHWLVQHRPQPPLTSRELDELYELPYTRIAHPPQDVPALRMIRDSVTIVRGCSGNCSFCAITRHQGAVIQSRSRESILAECTLLTRQQGLGGTISDLGGPTANLYGTSCAKSSCTKKDCLYPKTCPNLLLHEDRFLSLLEEVSGIPGVNHVFLSSGLRMDLLLKTPRLMQRIHDFHTPGALKIAPEHSCDDLLQIMHKESHDILEKFILAWQKLNDSLGKRMQLSPYVISAHPGSTMNHVQKLIRDFRKLNLPIYKFQDFTPTPGTLSTAMYVSGKSRIKGKPLPVTRLNSEKKAQRQAIEQGLMKLPQSGSTALRKRKK